MKTISITALLSLALALTAGSVHAREHARQSCILDVATSTYKTLPCVRHAYGQSARKARFPVMRMPRPVLKWRTATTTA